MSRKTVIEHGGKTYYGELGTVTSTRLSQEDHGIFTASLLVEWKGGGVSAGGFVLDEYDKASDRRVGTAFGLDHVMQIIETVGVASWEKIKGSNVFVLFESDNSWGSQSVGIAGLTNDKVLVFKEHAEYWRDREGWAD